MEREGKLDLGDDGDAGVPKSPPISAGAKRRAEALSNQNKKLKVLEAAHRPDGADES